MTLQWDGDRFSYAGGGVMAATFRRLFPSGTLPRWCCDALGVFLDASESFDGDQLPDKTLCRAIMWLAKELDVDARRERMKALFMLFQTKGTPSVILFLDGHGVEDAPADSYVEDWFDRTDESARKEDT